MLKFSKPLVVAIVVTVISTTAGLGGYYYTPDAEGTDKQQKQQQHIMHTLTQAEGAQGHKTVEYTLVAQNTTLEIAPHTRVQAWTYNGTIPGPTLRATEGDRVILHFLNHTPMPHTVHLHGDHDEKNDGVFQIVDPSGNYTYDFIAGPPGALMYHCHVMPVTQHVRMGLYGAMIIDPKKDLTPAREYVLVAGEYDTKDQLTNNPEYVFFNGFSNQYWDNPLPAKTNETVRIYYVNMGASPAYGFHIHGTIFDTYPSGILENNPIKVQTWEVSAGNGAIFEVKWPWEGRYVFHIHGLPEEKGTMGYFDVKDAPHNAIDGVDFAKTKSISMLSWQENLTRSLQKQDPNGIVSSQESVDEAAASSSSHDAMEKSTINATPSSSVVSSSSSGTATTATVTIPKNSSVNNKLTFEPAQMSASLGKTVTWVNDDLTLHTINSKQEGVFSSGFLSPKQTFEYTFAERGSYDYYCSLHPWMTGTVSVH